VTSDVLALAASEGQYAAVLTAKGKIVADVRILRFDDSLVVDVPRLAAPGFADVVRKYVNPRITRYIDESAATVAVGVFGVRAAHVAGGALGLSADALLALPAYGHLDAGGRTVVRIPDMRVDGFEVLAPADGRDALWQRLAEAGAVACSATTWEIVRVEAGRPEWGLDIDETTIPQEANLDELGAISYTKGCYTGQETVARIHFRGHVNRHLRGLRLAGARQALPPLKAALADGTGKAVGDVRTAVVSPRLGPIALAVVRREVEPGTTVTARWEGGEVGAMVTTLPFPDAW
jgi:folate-binding protein YgfZ